MHSKLTSAITAPSIQWQVEPGKTSYPAAIAAMEARVAAIREGSAPEQIWLVEHPPLYTAGTSAKKSDLLDAALFPVFEAGRGGQYTYHGPGQRVVYLMLDLHKLYAPAAPDLRDFVGRIEQWLIDTLAEFKITAFTREGRTGVWVKDGLRESKIAALGVRVRRGVSFHGASINLCPDLSHYRGIVPCGIQEHGVTSLKALGVDADMQTLDSMLQLHFSRHFGMPPVTCEQNL